MCVLLYTENKDFRTLVKVLSQVFAEWEGIGLCLEIGQNTLSNLGDMWRSEFTSLSS
jgi:hypothetical protein